LLVVCGETLPKVLSKTFWLHVGIILLPRALSLKIISLEENKCRKHGNLDGEAFL